MFAACLVASTQISPTDQDADDEHHLSRGKQDSRCAASRIGLSF